MSQKLIMPINNALLNVSYKFPEYRSLGLGDHYGTDMGGDTTIYASGNGTVAAAGYDNIFGNGMAIIYNDVYVPALNKVTNLVARYFHMENINVAAGAQVNKDTVIGKMGMTGKYVTGVHLHVEIDTDTKYPTYTPSLAGNSNIFKAGTDTTINPLKVFYLKVNAPDNQTMKNNPGTTWQTVGEAANMYKTEDTSYSPTPAPQPTPSHNRKYKVGQNVTFSTCYKSSTAPISEAISASNMARNHGKITKVITDKDVHNPYLLDNGLCWVNDGDIRSVDGVSTDKPAPQKGVNASHVGRQVRYSGRLYSDSYGNGAGDTINGTYTLSRVIDGRPTGALLNNGLGWVSAAECTLI